ncbi:MAG: DUF3082 domain-containing protein [Cyanobacteriota bacterium]|nr:DUF3082 domain-containing protein [Cyanobacteriota bacterium]
MSASPDPPASSPDPGPDPGSALASDPGAAAAPGTSPRKGPLSFLSGALTSGLLAWLALGLSGRVVAYYAAHPPHYSARVAQSIATAVKTLVVGMTFLATFTFAFVALGLFLTFLRSLWLAGGGQPAPGKGGPS